MGLDMYLHGKRNVRSYHKDDKQLATNIQAQFPELQSFDLQANDVVITEVTCELLYWRKANAIHAWFVTNVQNGFDDCKPYTVNRNKLIELRALCDRVLGFRELATDLLPPTSGFFFGSTDIDESYWNSLLRTVSAIDKCLALPDIWEFEYRSSW
jgi:hypothetical protein